MTRTGTPQQAIARLSSVYSSSNGGHDARGGFCPVCGTVAPCYRARRAAAVELQLGA